MWTRNASLWDCRNQCILEVWLVQWLGRRTLVQRSRYQAPCFKNIYRLTETLRTTQFVDIESGSVPARVFINESLTDIWTILALLSVAAETDENQRWIYECIQCSAPQRETRFLYLVRFLCCTSLSEIVNCYHYV